MVKTLAELCDENRAYHKSMKKLMGDLVEVMGDIAQSQQVLVGRVVPVNLLSEEGMPSDMPSVLGDNPLWKEFREWRQRKYRLTDWQAAVEGDTGSVSGGDEEANEEANEEKEDDDVEKEDDEV